MKMIEGKTVELLGSVTISLPNGAKSIVDSHGNVTIQSGSFRENIKFSKDIEEK